MMLGLQFYDPRATHLPEHGELRDKFDDIQLRQRHRHQDLRRQGHLLHLRFAEPVRCALDIATLISNNTNCGTVLLGYCDTIVTRENCYTK